MPNQSLSVLKSLSPELMSFHDLIMVSYPELSMIKAIALTPFGCSQAAPLYPPRVNLPPTHPK
jgi:hypothetical protein